MDERHAAHELRAQAAPPLPAALVGAVAAGVVVCALVLAVAVGGVHNRIGTPPAAPDLTAVLDYLIVGFIALGGVVAVALLLVGRARERAEDDTEENAPPISKGMRIGVVLLLIALVLAELWAFRALYRPGGSRQPQPPAIPQTVTTPTTTTETAPRGGPTLDERWFALAILAGAVVLAVALLALEHLRRTRELPPARDSALAGAVAGGIEDLESEPDPRRAVIKAYARMEQALAVDGLPRRASETPLEYLRRGLGRLPAGARPLARLTSLFELARFSRHEIDEPMRLEALDSLRQVRADLEEETE